MRFTSRTFRRRLSKKGRVRKTRRAQRPKKQRGGAFGGMDIPKEAIITNPLKESDNYHGDEVRE